MVVIANELNTSYQAGISLYYVSAVRYLVETGVKDCFEMLAFPNNVTVLQAAATDLTNMELALTVGLHVLQFGNSSLLLTQPITHPNITADFQQLIAPVNLTLAAIHVIQTDVLVNNATSLAANTTAAISVILGQQATILALLTSMETTMTIVSLEQTQFAQKLMYIFMSIILGVLVLEGLVVYLPLERRIKHMVDSLVDKNAELSRLTNELSTLTQLIPSGIFRADSSGSTIFANEHWLELTGLSIANAWPDHVHREDRAAVQEQWQRMLTDPAAAMSIEFRFLRGNDTLWILGQCRRETLDGKLRSIVGSFTDITERKRLEQERLEAMALAAKQAEEHRCEQARFVDIICHEIRNPLNGIVNNVDVLREIHQHLWQSLQSQPPTTETLSMLQELKQTNELWAAIELCTNHQRRITDDVLYISRLEEGRFSLLRHVFSLQGLVDAVMQMFQAEADADSVVLLCTYSSAALEMQRLRGDPQRIGQVLINLVGNAIKFTRKAPVRRVHVAVDIKPPTPNVGSLAHVVISVHDTGIGMTETEQTRLFVPFRQATSKTYSTYGGAGMGLFICKAILDAMAGTIAVVSRPAEGSVFTIEVPCERLSDDAPIDADSVPPGSGFGVAYRQPAPQGGVLSTALAEEATSERVSDEPNQIPEQPAVEPVPPVVEQHLEGRKPSTTEPMQGIPTSVQSARDQPLEQVGERSVQELVQQVSAVAEQAIAEPMVDVVSSPLISSNASPVQEPPVQTSIASSVQQPPPVQTSAESSVAVPKIAVLVVEDNDINQKVMRRQFETAPGKIFNVTIASNGKEAVDLTSHTRFDLIVMDIEMPVMGGLEATQRIRTRETELGLHPTVIIGLSGNARQEHVDAGMAAGMNDYLVKPCRQPALMACVARNLNITLEMP